MHTDHNLAFGKILRNFRLQKNLSQESLSFDAKLSRAFISLLERGLRSPTLDTIYLLAQALDVSDTEIFNALSKELENARN